MLKYMGLLMVGFMLTACGGDNRDPGYICMTNCEHACEDGIKGDSCRAQHQQEDNDHNADND